MFESVKDFITEISESYSDISNIKRVVRFGESLHVTKDVVDTLKEVNELLPYIDCSDVPDYALTLLNSLNLPERPKYGMEIATAAVYLFMGYFYMGKEDYDKARYCTEVVEHIPYVIYGKESLQEIKTCAARLNKTLP